MGMPVAIAGMHRSGTSMVARLLNLCGVYLGTDSEVSSPTSGDNAGYAEHRGFVDLNDEILEQLGGAWDKPPHVDDGWEHAPSLIPLRARAADLVQRFSGHDPWGWKDPRTSLTVPFWRDLVADCRVVVCLRNPLEVYRSLNARAFSSRAFTLELWQVYN